MPKSDNPRVKVGDNSGEDEDDFLDTSKAKMDKAHDKRLSLLIERVERLEEERKGIGDDIRDTYAEAKAVGYDTKIMRMIVRLRKMKPDDRAEMESLLDTYKAAIGLD
jgi:uncharacterized protein (UPF0335 family)